jgi:hypothetical protein
MYLLETERDIAVANCRELLRMTEDPRLRVELLIALLRARTGIIHSLRHLDLNQPGALVPETPPTRSGAAPCANGQPRLFSPR